MIFAHKTHKNISIERGKFEGKDWLLLILSIPQILITLNHRGKHKHLYMMLALSRWEWLSCHWLWLFSSLSHGSKLNNRSNAAPSDMAWSWSAGSCLLFWHMADKTFCFENAVRITVCVFGIPFGSTSLLKIICYLTPKSWSLYLQRLFTLFFLSP